MAAIYSNGGNCWNILGFNFTKRDALSSLYKISMIIMYTKFLVFYVRAFTSLCSIFHTQQYFTRVHVYIIHVFMLPYTILTYVSLPWGTL
jgi:hypothetical protein